MRGPNNPAAIRVFGVLGLLFIFFVAYKWGTMSAPIPKDVYHIGEVYTGENGARRPRTPVIRTTAPQDPLEPWIEQVSWTPRIFIYHNILTQEECDEIINLAAKDVTESLVVGRDGKPTKSEVRTSSGVFLGYKYLLASPLLRDYERRLAEWTHTPVENGENFYLLQYKVGEKYVPHLDYFGKEHEAQWKTPGNRMATILTYLGASEEGGETIFPKISLKVKPVKGDAVLFWDMHPDDSYDPDSLHGSEPVIKGLKYAMTKWIRQRASGNYYGQFLSNTDKQIIAEQDLDYYSKGRYAAPKFRG